jgi:hypothetical protein
MDDRYLLNFYLPKSWNSKLFLSQRPIGTRQLLPCTEKYKISDLKSSEELIAVLKIQILIDILKNTSLQS